MIKRNDKQVGFIYNNPEGYVRNIEGQSPLTFIGNGKDLSNLQIYGNSIQKTTTGKQLFNYKDIVIKQYVEVDDEGFFTVIYDNTSGTSTKYIQVYPRNNINLKTSTQYAIFTEVKSVSGDGRLYSSSTISSTGGQINSNANYLFSNLSDGMIKKTIGTTRASFNNIVDGIRTFVQFDAGQSGSITFRISLLEDTSIQPDNFVYEPYTGAKPSPNPDYPQEIESVGDKTKNLLKPSSVSARDNITPVYRTDGTLDYLLLNGTYTSTTIYNISDKNNPLYSNNMVINGITNGSTTTFKLQTWRTDSNASIGEAYSSGIKIQNGYNFYVRLVIYAGTYNNIKIYPMIYQGDNLNEPYEPYYEGYKIPVNVRSENLFDGILELGTFDGSGGKINSDKAIRSSNFNEISNINNIFVSGISHCTIWFYDKDKNPISSVAQENTQVPNNAKFFKVRTWEIDNITDLSTKIMINEGSTAKPYQPYFNETINVYLDQPLHKIGDISDYIDWKNNQVVRMFSEEIISKYKTWRYVDSNQRFTINQLNADFLKNIKITRSSTSISKTNIICTHFVSGTQEEALPTSNVIGFSKWGDSNYMYVGAIKNSLEDFIAFLDSNEIKLVYPLETPVIESINLQPISTIKGTNIIEVQTQTTPSNLKITQSDRTIKKVLQTINEIDNTTGLLVPKEVLLFEEGFTRVVTGAKSVELNRPLARTLKNLKITGNTTQTQYQGNQIIDFNNPQTLARATYTFTNNILNLKAVIGSGIYNCIRYDLLDIFKANIGKTLYFSYTNYSFTTGARPFVQVKYNVSGTEKYITLQDSAGTINTGVIPSEISTASYCLIEFYVNNSSTSVIQEINATWEEPMLAFSQSATYEPFTGLMASPNPQYPQPIESVGDKTVNLFNKETVNRGQWINASGGLENEEGTSHSDFIAVDNKTYNISWRDRWTTVALYDSNKQFIERVTIMSGDYTFNVQTKFIKVNMSDTVLDIFQITEGSGVKPYEPYGKYKLEIRDSSKNLLDSSLMESSKTQGGITFINNGDGTFDVSGTATENVQLSIYYNTLLNVMEKDTYYYFYCNVPYNSTTFNISTLVFTNDGAKYYTPQNVYSYSWDKINYTNVTLYIPSGVTVNAKNVKVMLVKSDTIDTQYEPYRAPIIKKAYLNAPLRKSGNIADYIDWKEKKVVRNIGEYLINGTETINEETTGINIKRFTINISEINIKPNVDVDTLTGYKCNRFIETTPGSSWWSSDTRFAISPASSLGYIHCIIVYKDYQDISLFRQWLVQNNVLLDYVLATPVTETIELQDIPVTLTTKTIDLTNKTSPSEITVTYKSYK